MPMCVNEKQLGAPPAYIGAKPRKQNIASNSTCYFWYKT